MAITEEMLIEAFKQIGQTANNFKDDIEGLKNRPAQEQFQQSWQAGQRFARSKGYNDQEQARLLKMNTEKSAEQIWQDMVRLDPTPPTPAAGILGGLPADEFKMLMNGDEDGFTNLAVSRALRGE